MKKKSTKQLPAVSEAEVAALQKSEAVLLRLTKQDKQAIVTAASTLRLTVTELVTRSALMVAAKVPK
jgi:uncharacterized protein (DUF1778 family)